MSPELRTLLLPHFTHGKRPVSSAVYGTVSVVALVAAASHDSGSAGRVLAAASVSMLVIWAVHVYASALEHTGPKNLAWRRAVAVAVRDELGIIQGASAPLTLLLLGAVGLLSDERAIEWSMWCGVAQLTLMPFVWLRRSGSSLWESLAASAAAGLLGLVLIVFNVFVH